MSVKTHLNEDAFRTLAKAFGFCAFDSIEPTRTGSAQSNWFVNTGGQRYVLRLYENRTADAVRFEIETLLHLRKTGFNAPVPVCGLQIYEGKPVALFTYLDGTTVPEETFDHRIAMVRKAAELALVTKDFRPLHTMYRTNYVPAMCPAYLAGIGSSNPRKRDWFEKMLASLELPDTLPMGICHCDWSVDNMLFDGERICAVLDFDNANYTYLCMDLAYQLEPWKHGFDHDHRSAFPKGAYIFDPTNARKLVHAYEQVRPLTEAERTHLFDVHKLGILIDCLWFFDRGDVDDFYERRKIEALDAIGREGYHEALFGQ